MVLISKEEVQRIAALARVGLTDEEVVRATKDLSGVLDHFSAIQDIATNDAPMAADVSGLKNISRNDGVQANVLCDTQALMDAAPATSQNHVQVHGVFE